VLKVAVEYYAHRGDLNLRCRTAPVVTHGSLSFDPINRSTTPYLHESDGLLAEDFALSPLQSLSYLRLMTRRADCHHGCGFSPPWTAIQANRKRITPYARQDLS